MANVQICHMSLQRKPAYIVSDNRTEFPGQAVLQCKRGLETADQAAAAIGC